MADPILMPEEEMLEKLKRLLGKTGTVDPEAALIKDALDDAIVTVRNYCNFEELDLLPPALYSTVVKIAVDIWRAEGYGKEERPQEIKSVQRGDVTTSFASSTFSSAGGAGFTRAYENILNSFRKLGW